MRFKQTFEADKEGAKQTLEKSFQAGKEIDPEAGGPVRSSGSVV